MTISFFEIPIPNIAAPGEPQDVQVAANGPDFISLFWTHSMNRGIPPLSRHQIIVSGGGEVYMRAVEGDEASANVTGLRPGTLYTFRVVAVSVYGNLSVGSPPSEPITALTTNPGMNSPMYSHS